MAFETEFPRESMLFVDDNKTIQKIIKNIVDDSKMGVEVLEALTGEDAIEILQNVKKGRKPKMILLDLNLPAMSGQEVFEKIQQDQDLREIPVIVLTSSEDQAELNDLKRLGVKECYTKPFDFHVFNALVEGVLTKWLMVQTEQPCQNP
jgi:CheY-like chemotaxis protein